MLNNLLLKILSYVIQATVDNIMRHREDAI
jgi:hypothetical protein